MKKIVLASGSPARKALLEQIGVKFVIDKSDFEEDMTQDLAPHELVVELARGKAEDVARRYADAIVIGADTIIVFEGEVMGKPHTVERARKMLKNMSGKAHSVISGFVVVDTSSGKMGKFSEETSVYFRELNDSEIDKYIAREMPLQKAGAYAIQNLGAVLVEKIDGDYSNVMGLPVTRLAGVLKEFGVDVL